MDREHELRQLDSERKNTKLPMWERRRSNRFFEQIQAQIRDKRLTAMRERLIKATRSQDRLEIWKITNQIKEYMKEPKIPMEDMV